MALQLSAKPNDMKELAMTRLETQSGGVPSRAMFEILIH